MVNVTQRVLTNETCPQAEDMEFDISMLSPCLSEGIWYQNAVNSYQQFLKILCKNPVDMLNNIIVVLILCVDEC